MRLTRKIRLFLRSLFSKSSVEDDLEAEFRDYVEWETENQMAAGASREEAMQTAQRHMQGKERIKEECRDVRGTSHIENFVRDLRYGLRVLLKNPGFSVTAALTLALGIATSATLFSVVESQLWRPLAFPQSERVALIAERNLKQERGSVSVSVADFADWREQTRAFERLAAMAWPSRRIFLGNQWRERLVVATASSGFFETLGTNSQVGRTFQRSDEHPGNQTTAILTKGLACRAFGSVENALGKSIRLDDQRYSVIGILPDTFHLDVLETPDVFLSLAIPSDQARAARNLLVVGRLRPTMTRAQGLADMEAMARGIAMQHPDTNANVGVGVEDLRNTFIGPSSRTWLLLLLAFSIFILLISCLNVAALQFMRAVVREREFAVREALGASRGAIVRQSIAESAWLALSGVLVGVVLALLGVHLLARTPISGMLIRESPISMNLWSVVFVLVVSVLATLAFGLAPEFLGPKSDLEPALRNAGRAVSSSPSAQRRLRFLSSAQVALAFLALFGAGLFTFSCRSLQQIPLGFDPHNISALQISLGGGKYSGAKQTEVFYQKVMAEASSLRAIQDFALSSSLPLTGGLEVKFARADGPRPASGQEPFSFTRIVTPHYFQVLGIQILRGRGFTPADTAAGPRVALINQNLANRFFPNQDPIGRQLLLLHGEEPAIPQGKVEIIGIAANVKDVGLNEIPFNDLYLPVSQGFPSHMYAIAKTSAPATVGPLLRQMIQGVDPEQFEGELQPLDSYVAAQMRGPRSNLVLVSAFAGLALLLTAVAMFGTLFFAVTQQARDIGLHIAVGATPVNVVAMVLRQVFRLTAVGSVCGLGIALALGSLMRERLYLVPHQHDGILYGVSIYDPFSLAFAGTILFLFAALAGLAPAVRALRIDPNMVLRCE